MAARAPVEITGAWLHTTGRHLVVQLEIDGEWVPVIIEWVGHLEQAISHIVEPEGIRNKMRQKVDVWGD